MLFNNNNITLDLHKMINSFVDTIKIRELMLIPHKERTGNKLWILQYYWIILTLKSLLSQILASFQVFYTFIIFGVCTFNYL